ncbi:MAG: hypothetical protein QXP98_04695 [Thermoproteus sp.]
MIVRIRDVELGGELLARSVVLRESVRGTVDGLVPMPGLNVVAGRTGSGKTLLAESLWLGTAWSLAKLTGDEMLVTRLVGSTAVRPLSLTYEVAFDEGEVPGGGYVKVRVEDGLLESFEHKGDAKALTYALSHIIAVPSTLRASLFTPDVIDVFYELTEKREDCQHLIAVLPPIRLEYNGEHVPCHEPETIKRPFTLKSAIVPGRLERFYVAESSGEVDVRLLRIYRDALRELKLDAKRYGVSVVPLLYFDDAFNNLHSGAMRDLAEFNTPDWSLYVATHRLDVGVATSKTFYLTYGLPISTQLDAPCEFRFGLVDAELLDRETAVRVCKEVVAPDESLCAQL